MAVGNRGFLLFAKAKTSDWHAHSVLLSFFMANELETIDAEELKSRVRELRRFL
jgi:hypothetical protein